MIVDVIAAALTGMVLGLWRASVAASLALIAFALIRGRQITA